ncbi:hypothetical protein PSPO01_15961 [Paraphaeosphaeria sporulosa]
MTDRRGVRSSSRRTTPPPQPPQPPPKATTTSPQAGRTTRQRGTRGASRHVEALTEPAKPTRRSARRASIDSVLSENEPDLRALSWAEQEAQKGANADLTVVEEVDTHGALASSSRPSTEVALPRRSLGAVSEMSGTTAMSSFTLHEEVAEFLDLLVPAEGGMLGDNRRIEHVHDPTSDFFADYNDLDRQLRTRLVRYRRDDQQYIQIRTVHAALLGANQDAPAQTGLDLLLYQANLIIFAKDMISLDHNDKTTATDGAFDPDATLDEVFFDSRSESSPQSGVVRGWTMFALGGDDSALPEAFVQRVAARITAIREFFSTGEMSQGQGQEGSVHLDDLSAAFPWAAVMLRLVGWQGGAYGILEKIKAERERSGMVAETGRIISRSPRKARSSFERNRRRGSAKVDPDAEVDTEALGKLIAREGGARVHSQVVVASANALQESHKEEIEPIALEYCQGIGSLQQDDIESQPHQNNEHDGTTNAVEQAVKSVTADEVVVEPVEQIPVRPRLIQESEIPEWSRPPQSTINLVNLHKETRTSDKENRGTSLFKRQVNAQRVPFGDGFDDSQPTPGPSRSQPSAGAARKNLQRSRPKKRKIAEVSDDNNDDDAFGSVHRSANVKQQRAVAPKRPRDDNDKFPPIEDFQQPENDEPSEAEAPEMTEEAPPRSTFHDTKALARANTVYKPRRAKRMWTVAEEEALISYMSDCPRQYSRILAIDRESPRKYFHALENGQWIAQRSQIDLKDKARVMAKNMIKSGADLRPGFDGVITPALGKQLRDDGWEW